MRGFRPRRRASCAGASSGSTCCSRRRLPHRRALVGATSERWACPPVPLQRRGRTHRARAHRPRLAATPAPVGRPPVAANAAFGVLHTCATGRASSPARGRPGPAPWPWRPASGTPGARPARPSQEARTRAATRAKASASVSISAAVVMIPSDPAHEVWSRMPSLSIPVNTAFVISASPVTTSR